jgi:tyrosyl-tRNA synthetase
VTQARTKNSAALQAPIVASGKPAAAEPTDDKRVEIEKREFMTVTGKNVDEIIAPGADEGSSPDPAGDHGHWEKLPEAVRDEAEELARGTEVLPAGKLGLARKIHEYRSQGKVLRVKLGIDPTATDLHIGHAVVFRKLRRFQEFGHQVVLIIGGFTARIGDPSGRDATRPELTEAQVGENARDWLSQMSLILDLSKTEVVNNADWLANMGLSEWLKLASQVTVNRLIAKEAFGNRLEKQLPVALHELFYPLLQGYDSVAIRADIELGGTDQRFNILQGRELQPHYNQEPQLAMLLPLLVGTDGEKKMSKSYNNYIGLKESPDDMFGKTMRIPDGLLLKYFELTTSLTGAEVDQIEKHLEQGGNPKDVKQRLATQLVRQYCGEEAAQSALATWERVHSQQLVPDDIPSHTVAQPTAVFRLLVDSKLVSSGGEAKRLAAEGGIRLDGEQIKDPNFVVEIVPGTDKVLQVGRRKFVKLRN